MNQQDDIALDPCAGLLTIRTGRVVIDATEQAARITVLDSPDHARAHVCDRITATEVLARQVPDDPFPPRPVIEAPAVNVAILALDLGTKTGYALRRRDGRIIHGTEDFTPRSSWAPGQKWLRFRSWLSSLIATHQVTQIAFEDVRRHPLGQVLAAHAYGGFRAMLEMVADQHRVTLDTVGVGQIKKHWTGNGTAKKPEMIDQAKLRGFRVTDDNEADGLAILHWALAKEAGTWTAPQAKAKKPRTRAPKEQGKLL